MILLITDTNAFPENAPVYGDGDVAFAPTTFHVPLHPELSQQLAAFAASQNVRPETIIAEAVRAYLGADA